MSPPAHATEVGVTPVTLGYEIEELPDDELVVVPQIGVPPSDARQLTPVVLQFVWLLESQQDRELSVLHIRHLPVPQAGNKPPLHCGTPPMHEVILPEEELLDEELEEEIIPDELEEDEIIPDDELEEEELEEICT